MRSGMASFIGVIPPSTSLRGALQGDEAISLRHRSTACGRLLRCARNDREARGRSDRSFLALIVIMNLVKQTPGVGAERPMQRAGRAAGVGRRVERPAALAVRVVADDEIAGDEIDFLPMVVDEGRGREAAAGEAQQPRAASHLAPLVEIAGEDLLLNARGIA